MFDAYNSSFLALWVILTTIIFQAIVYIRLHRRQRGYKVGVMDPALGQTSFLFRAYRTFWNSIENIIPLFGIAILAILSEYDSLKLSIILWIYAMSRIIHMIIYYKVVTNKNPSLRSIPFGIGFLACFYLIVDLGIFLF